MKLPKYTPDPEYDHLVKCTEYLVEANSNETHELWFKFHAIYGYSWEQDRGFGEQIGWVNKMPLMLTLVWNRVGGRLICFYDPTGWVNDKRIVNKWLERTFPGRGKVDAMNFHNALQDLKVPRPRDMDERSKKYQQLYRELCPPR